MNSLMRYALLFLLLVPACKSEEENPGDPLEIKADTAELKEDILPSPISGERMAAETVVMDTIGGEDIFRLYKHAPVTSTSPVNSWMEVGLELEISATQKKLMMIRKGEKLYADKKEIGVAVENIPLRSAYENNDGIFGTITGYTRSGSIHPGSDPENALAEIISSSSSLNMENYLKEFGFYELQELLEGYKSYAIDETWINDPSPSPRIWLVMEHEKPVAVIHTRPLNMDQIKPVKINQNYFYSAVAADQPTSEKIISAFLLFVSQVD